jgi:hypothetical protein
MTSLNGTCSEELRVADSRSARSHTDYGPKSIRILDDEEAQARFPFARVEALARRHPDASERFIRRLVEACMQVGFDVDLAARRYLEGDRSVHIPPELYEAHAALCRSPRHGGRGDAP